MPCGSNASSTCVICWDDRDFPALDAPHLLNTVKLILTSAIKNMWIDGPEMCYSVWPGAMSCIALSAVGVGTVAMMRTMVHDGDDPVFLLTMMIHTSAWACMPLLEVYSANTAAVIMVLVPDCYAQRGL